MTTGGTASSLFGLSESFPCHGWVVLDAAREHRFTGELVFDVMPTVSVYLDRGRIYLAERTTEAPLGIRLIDAGAINAAQLEHGAMQVGDTPHLGRLFDRVPSIDRQFVVLMTEMMNDECVAWVAQQEVAGVTSTPYLHHPSGVHRWDRPVDAIDLAPGDPLPAPPPDAAPVGVEAPMPHASTAPATEVDTDSLIAWDEPTMPGEPDVPPAADETAPVADDGPVDRSGSILDSDWADRLETHGLPEIGSDPLAVPTPLPPLPADHPDRFELIWPSGEIDDEFDSTGAVDGAHDRDHDRAGPTARVVRSVEFGVEPAIHGGTETVELWDFETTGPSFAPIEHQTTEHRSDETNADPHLTVITDDAVLSMRRAVEAIEAGSLATRRPVEAQADAAPATDVYDTDIVVPGRVATRTESSLWCVRGFENSTTRSVFDEAAPTLEVKPEVEERAVVQAAEVESNEEPQRVSALRRLIGGLRRR